MAFPSVTTKESLALYSNVNPLTRVTMKNDFFFVAHSILEEKDKAYGRMIVIEKPVEEGFLGNGVRVCPVVT